MRANTQTHTHTHAHSRARAFPRARNTCTHIADTPLCARAHAFARAGKTHTRNAHLKAQPHHIPPVLCLERTQLLVQHLRPVRRRLPQRAARAAAQRRRQAAGTAWGTQQRAGALRKAHAYG